MKEKREREKWMSHIQVLNAAESVLRVCASVSVMLTATFLLTLGS